MDEAELKRIAHVLVGDSTGWRARFAGVIGVTPGHVGNMLKGTRAMTDEFKLAVLSACIAESDRLRGRARDLDMIAIQLGMTMKTTVRERPAPAYTREQYEAEAEEAEQIISEMTGHAGAQENDDE